MSKMFNFFVPLITFLHSTITLGPLFLPGVLLSRFITLLLFSLILSLHWAPFHSHCLFGFLLPHYLYYLYVHILPSMPFSVLRGSSDTLLLLRISLHKYFYIFTTLLYVPYTYLICICIIKFLLYVYILLYACI